MLTEAFLLTPYLAIAASFTLTGVVAAICASCSRFRSRAGWSRSNGSHPDGGCST